MVVEPTALEGVSNAAPLQFPKHTGFVKVMFEVSGGGLLNVIVLMNTHELSSMAVSV
jgi:hypothetical protein